MRIGKFVLTKEQRDQGRLLLPAIWLSTCASDRGWFIEVSFGIGKLVLSASTHTRFWRASRRALPTCLQRPDDCSPSP